METRLEPADTSNFAWCPPQEDDEPLPHLHDVSLIDAWARRMVTVCLPAHLSDERLTYEREVGATAAESLLFIAHW